MVYCKHCGTELDEESEFCNTCGKKIDTNITEEQNPYAPPKESVPEFFVRKNPWQYFIGVFKKYAVFKGRARRAEYWWFVLFANLFSIFFSVLDVLLFGFDITDTGVLELSWRLAVVLPSLGVSVRRMHDCNKSGWFMLIPIYGQIVLPCTKGTHGSNRYGGDPKEEAL
ncbi:MAG: zinc-ribbon domain-containing protein [Treponema sp.]|jgi:uncharacterized membrane protein YhaH (DUF805 family)|nr:zinc-ribbon domain-containing protein [Treponema sp.]